MLAGGDHDLGRGDELPTAAVVLTKPGFVEAEALQPHDEVQIALEGQRGVLAQRVVRRDKDAEGHAVGGVARHEHSLSTRGEASIAAGGWDSIRGRR